MFTEIVSRPLRWADDGWATADKFTLHKTCLYADQDAYADVLPDMASGYMLFPKAWWCASEVCNSAYLPSTSAFVSSFGTQLWLLSVCAL